MTERLFLRLEDDPLYAPETTVPPGTMREFAVPAALRDYVAHVMAYDEHLPPGTEVTERVLPDGALRLIFDLQGGAAEARVAGPSTSPVLLTIHGHVRGLSVTLRPGAALALLGASARELADRAVPWDDVAGAAHRSLAAAMQAAPDDRARVRLLLDALQAMLRDTGAAERRRALQAAQLIRAAGGSRPVGAIADALGLGERRLQQIFRAQVGLSPRAWGRLARMHECLRLLRRDAGLPWTQLAADGGFYDQSHLINEFRALCGLTPEQFLRRQRPVSESSKTGR